MLSAPQALGRYPDIMMSNILEIGSPYNEDIILAEKVD
jgi:hypothetical protein